MATSASPGAGRAGEPSQIVTQFKLDDLGTSII